MNNKQQQLVFMFVIFVMFFCMSTDNLIFNFVVYYILAIVNCYTIVKLRNKTFNQISDYTN